MKDSWQSAHTFDILNEYNVFQRKQAVVTFSILLQIDRLIEQTVSRKLSNKNKTNNFEQA